MCRNHALTAYQIALLIQVRKLPDHDMHLHMYLVCRIIVFFFLLVVVGVGVVGSICSIHVRTYVLCVHVLFHVRRLIRRKGKVLALNDLIFSEY